MRWDALNGPTDACAAVNALTPTNYKATDISHYQEVFLKLRDHQPVRVEFYFETAFNSAAGYIVIAPGGTANAIVAEWTSCDMAPLDVHTANRVLPDPMTLTSCAYATTVSDQIGCVRSAFGGASSGPPTCTVPSNNGGPP